jgi:hypothetical protein
MANSTGLVTSGVPENYDRTSSNFLVLASRPGGILRAWQKPVQTTNGLPKNPD